MTDKRFLIIADDFTGANDTGVQIKKHGLAASVLLKTDDLSNAQLKWAKDVLYKEATQCEELDMPGLVCTEELCDCFSTRCENNCTKYLDVQDCKQVDPDSPEARP